MLAAFLVSGVFIGMPEFEGRNFSGIFSVGKGCLLYTSLKPEPTLSTEGVTGGSMSGMGGAGTGSSATSTSSSQ